MNPFGFHWFQCVMDYILRVSEITYLYNLVRDNKKYVFMWTYEVLFVLLMQQLGYICDHVSQRVWIHPAALSTVNHGHFWPHWMLESSKHAPDWRASEERGSSPALPVCLAGWEPRGQGPAMDGPVAGSLLPRWLAMSAGPQPGGVAPWRQAMIRYANFHLLPPPTPVDCVVKWQGGGTGAWPNVCVCVCERENCMCLYVFHCTWTYIFHLLHYMLWTFSGDILKIDYFSAFMFIRSSEKDIEQTVSHSGSFSSCLQTFDRALRRQCLPSCRNICTTLKFSEQL